eukprot:GHUV01007824.1.p1 GENE.GHUV01007824.1~~GHUV01007824.1.p1  ORF type:complete len:613 (+),score=211.59 GHUV01007824.1:409-2247(+)
MDIPSSPSSMMLQLPQTDLDGHIRLKASQKLGLKALTDLTEQPDISLDSCLVKSLMTTVSVHAACVLNRSNSSSSSSSGPAEVDSAIQWAPDTPPGTPGKLQHSSSVDSSTSSSGVSSPRALHAVAADTQLQEELQNLAAANVAALPGVTFGLSNHARDAFRGKRVLFISGGTRGDVQPATALAIALSGLGATVALATDASFKGFVKQHGLQHISLGGNARDMMALTVKWGGMLPTDMGGMFWLRGQIQEVMDSVWSAAEAFGPDLILANQLAYGQVHAAEKLGVPLHVILTIPWVPTRSIAHPWARAYGANIVEYINAAAGAILTPCFRVLRWLGCDSKGVNQLEQRMLHWVEGTANYISTPLLDHMAWSGIADLMAAFRHKLGLTQFSRNNLGSSLYRYPTTCLFSSHLVPRPADWGSNISVSGFLSLDDAAQRFGNSSRSSSSGSTNVTDSSSSAELHGSNNNGARSGTDHSITALQSPGRTVPPSRSSMTDSNSSAAPPSAATAACWQPPQQLTDFLAAGPTPLYIGFGSMVVQDPQKLMQMVLAAVQQLPRDQRVVICSGWAGIGAESDGSRSDESSTTNNSNGGSLSPDGRILFIQEAPHDWLFAR